MSLAFPKPVKRERRPPQRIARKVRLRQRPRGGAWQADREECDMLTARILKVERPACENCGDDHRLTLQWAHGVSRRHPATRYDSHNGFILCFACHLRFTHNQPAWDAWLERRLGEGVYKALKMRSQLPARFEPGMVLALRTYAKNLGVLTDEGWKAWQQEKP